MTMLLKSLHLSFAVEYYFPQETKKKMFVWVKTKILSQMPNQQNKYNLTWHLLKKCKRRFKIYKKKENDIS